MMDHHAPDLILLLSGKRKSGKDYVGQRVVRLLVDDGEHTVRVITLSSPLKEAYAHENGLDYEKLLDSSEYKEKYRADMIRWGEKRRDQDPGYFCRRAIEKAAATSPEEATIKSSSSSHHVWLVTDVRRRTDLDYFRQNYSPERLCLARVTAEESVRKQRGWIFTPGVDDAPSECDLDSLTDWNIVINNNNETELNKSLEEIIKIISRLNKH